jgi:hypothetical protein
MMAKAESKTENKTENRPDTEAKADGISQVGLPKTIIVTARQPFRRAGFAFGTEAVELVLADLTEAQIRALATEPMLVVTPGPRAAVAEAE